ncbi:DUF6776 family protein, partial [Paraglaciecola sp.]|uniref:DUF6776 family protein n=1 Tax=Paraglaciecola sp. TaxID=1920173 RepID=UPI003EF507A2
ELVLIKQEKIKQALKVSLKITLIGSENGQAKQYALKSLLVNSDKSLTFGFKYFQVIEGELKLPAGFVVENVSVYADIYQFKRKKGQLTTVFEWLVAD